MSSTFDTMQQAVAWFEGHVAGDQHVVDQAHDISTNLMEAIDALHDYSHENGDVLNRGRQAVAAERVRTCMAHEDAAERAMWLRVKMVKRRR